jgi:hypothetical protein
MECRRDPLAPHHGSGETAPTMIKPHRELFERLGDAPAVILDTPYGFQENAAGPSADPADKRSLHADLGDTDL